MSQSSNGRAGNEGLDGWGTSKQSQYSPDSFYTRSINKHDHSFHLRVNLPPDVHTKMCELVGTKTIQEYRSVPDIVRDAVVHRLKWLEEHGYFNAENVLTDEMELSIIANERSRRETRAKIVEDATAELDDAMRDGDVGHLKRRLPQVEELAQTLPQPYQGRLMDLVMRIGDYASRMEIPVEH